MGTTVRIILYAEDGEVARTGAQAAYALVARLDSLFSDYRTDSEIAQLGLAHPGDPVPVSAELLALLVCSQGWSERTAGAFDVTLGPLTRLWRWSSRRGELPDSTRLAASRSASGFRLLELDTVRSSVRLLRPGMVLDLGGIAKGFAADAMLEALARRGLRSVMVDAGGDLALGTAPPGEPGWRIMTPVGDSLVLSNVGVATSGDNYRHLEIEGVRYSHVLDPATGLGVRDVSVVTVIAPDATAADALASALTVMTPAAGRTLLETLEGVAARVSGGQSYQTPNFPARGATSSLKAHR